MDWSREHLRLGLQCGRPLMGCFSHIVIPGALGRAIIEALLTRLLSGNWNVTRGEARSAVRHRSGDDFHDSTCHSMTYPVKGLHMFRICVMNIDRRAGPPSRVACMSQSIVLWDFAISNWHEAVDYFAAQTPDHPTFGRHLDVRHAVPIDAS